MHKLNLAQKIILIIGLIAFAIRCFTYEPYITGEWERKLNDTVIFHFLGIISATSALMLIAGFFGKKEKGKKEPVDFDTVKVRSLQVVDDSGKVQVQLSTTSLGGYVDICSNDGNPSVMMSADAKGGKVMCVNTRGKAATSMGVYDMGNFVMVFGKDGERRVIMAATANRSGAEFSGCDGKTRASIGVDEYGNGFVDTLDRNGHLV